MTAGDPIAMTTETPLGAWDTAASPFRRGPVSIGVILGLAMGPAVALGLARFAYALLLPAMCADLGWSFADAGSMNTANAVGYLLGSLTAAPVARHLGDKRVFAAGLVLTALALGASGLTASFHLLLALRLLAGVTGAVSFVLGAGLASAAVTSAHPAHAPTVLGVYFSGNGIGIAVSAVAVPPLLASLGWHAGWLVLGALALAAAFAGWSVLGRIPLPSHELSQARGGWSLRFLACALLSYGLFGAGYIAYATFIIAYLRHDMGFSGGAITLFWTLLGLAAVAGAFAWGPVLGRLKGGWGAVATMTLLTTGVALPLLGSDRAGIYLSALLFGGSIMAVVAANMSFVRRAARPHAWTEAMAVMTAAFGAGQCVGPYLSGLLSDGPQGVRAGLWLSAYILLAAILIAALQREPRRQAP
jgi:predicted MFS family arabinose efflux permease